MTIAIKVYGSNAILGKWQFLEAFFSTICYRLEGNDWGSKYPIIMNDFSEGLLAAENIEAGYKEIKIIEAKMEKMDAKDLIMDVRDLTIKHDIKNIDKVESLKKCFTTIYGQSLFAIFDEYIGFAVAENLDVKIVPWSYSEIEKPAGLESEFFGITLKS